MKIKSILFLSFSFLMISCGSTSTQTTSVNPHAEPHVQMHEEFINEQNQQTMNKKFAQELSGTYLGMIPCADCEKIIYRLILNDDLTYQSKKTYQGRSDIPFEKKGTYTINSQFIIQLDDGGGMNMFKKESKGLLMLDKKENEITGNLADKYYMLPIVKSVKNNKQNKYQQILYKKYQEGIDFYAFGNEPFWSLDMDFEKGFRFKNLDGLDYNAPAVDPVKAMDADVTRYRTVTESGELIVQLYHKECTDSMSGQKFEYSVSIDFKTSKETDYKTYKSCGNYVPDYRLHDIWAIIEVNGIKVNTSDFKKDAPRMEINLTKKTVYGTDGCNTFRGSVKVDNNNIKFGPFASTRMACFDNTEISSKIGKTLSSKTLTFKRKNNLVFYENGKKVMELKHID